MIGGRTFCFDFPLVPYHPGAWEGRKAVTTKTPQQLEAEIEKLRVRLKAFEAEGARFRELETQLETTLEDLRVHQEELRAQNEELLESREVADTLHQKYSLLFEQSPLTYLLIDQNQVMHEVNFATTHLLKADKRSLLGKPLLSYVDKGQRDVLWRHLRQVFQDRERASDAFVLIPKKGDPVPIQMTSQIVEDPEKERPLCLSVVFDLTERKRIEEELQLSVALLEATLDSTADGILAVDSEGRIARYNKRFQEIWRIPDSVLASCDDNEALEFALAQTEDPDGFMKKVKELYADPESVSFDIIPLRNGAVIERYSQPERIGERIVGRVWSFRDVTDRVKALEDLKRSNAELEQFAYVTSHDLREPLNTIIGFNELLALNYVGKLDDDADEFINLSLEAARRMTRMIQDLLDYSRISTVGGEMEPTEFDAALDVALANLHRKIARNDAAITRDPLPMLMADESLVIRLFQNLVDNAIKYRSEDKRPEIHIGAEEQGGRWLFSVRDNGIGIDEAERKSVFLVFKRLHRDEKFDGTGIGLSACKAIVERHHGRIWVEGPKDGGSVFRFTMPSMESL